MQLPAPAAGLALLASLTLPVVAHGLLVSVVLHVRRHRRALATLVRASAVVGTVLYAALGHPVIGPVRLPSPGRGRTGQRCREQAGGGGGGGDRSRGSGELLTTDPLVDGAKRACLTSEAGGSARIQIYALRPNAARPSRRRRHAAVTFTDAACPYHNRQSSQGGTVHVVVLEATARAGLAPQQQIRPTGSLRGLPMPQRPGIRRHLRHPWRRSRTTCVAHTSHCLGGRARRAGTRMQVDVLSLPRSGCEPSARKAEAAGTAGTAMATDPGPGR